MDLTADNVRDILMDCLFQEGEDTTNHIKAEGVRHTIGFHPERLEKHRHEIAELCDQLPEDFKGGHSFLNACITKDGQQWGEHSNVEELLCLGLATNKITMLMPRELWQALPGGMPYFKIN